MTIGRSCDSSSNADVKYRVPVLMSGSVLDQKTDFNCEKALMNEGKGIYTLYRRKTSCLSDIDLLRDVYRLATSII